MPAPIVKAQFFLFVPIMFPPFFFCLMFLLSFGVSAALVVSHLRLRCGCYAEARKELIFVFYTECDIPAAVGCYDHLVRRKISVLPFDICDHIQA